MSENCLVISMQSRMARCAVCGGADFHGWGIPVDAATGEVVANDFAGDWCGKPACRECFARHAAGEFIGDFPKY